MASGSFLAHQLRRLKLAIRAGPVELEQLHQYRFQLLWLLLGDQCPFGWRGIL